LSRASCDFNLPSGDDLDLSGFATKGPYMRTIAMRLGGVGGVVMVAGALLSIGPALPLGPVPDSKSPHWGMKASPVQATGPTQRPAPEAADINDCKSADLDRVIAGCTRLMATDLSDQEHASALSNRGAAYANTGRREQAMADLDAAIRLDPTNAFAHLNRGLVRDALGHHEAAIADLTEAIRLKPDWARAFAERGLILLHRSPQGGVSQHERLALAIADFDEFLRFAAGAPGLVSDREIGRIFIERGFAHTLKGDHAGAIADYDRALRKDPQHLQALLNRGMSLAVLGETDRARADLRRLVELPARSEADRRNQEIARKRLAEIEAELKAESQQNFMRRVQEEYERCIAARGERRACGPSPQSVSRKQEVAQATEEETSTYMTGGEIMRSFEASSSDGSMSGSGPYREYYASGGQIRGRSFRGTWWVDGAQFCAAYAGRQSRCYRVRKLGGPHIAWEREGTVVGTGRIVRGNPHGL
jgi:tetratricopeptide (TPR) repeat protein